MTTSASRTGPPGLLGIYLNDHLGGATGGLELARRVARAHRGTPAGEPLAAVAAEIGEDRRTLLGIMDTLRVPVRRYKVALGWAAEKGARLKLNGRLVRRSPLSSLLELESLLIGIEGKAAGWRTLRRLTDAEPRLDPALLDRLHERARRQADTVEELRAGAARQVLTT